MQYTTYYLSYHSLCVLLGQRSDRLQVSGFHPFHSGTIAATTAWPLILIKPYKRHMSDPPCEARRSSRANSGSCRRGQCGAAQASVLIQLRWARPDAPWRSATRALTLSIGQLPLALTSRSIKTTTFSFSTLRCFATSG